MKRYGLLDTIDNLWMGNDKGPLIYADKMLAKVAALACADSLGWPTTRARAVRFKHVVRKKHDDVPMVRSVVESIARLEEGLV